MKKISKVLTLGLAAILVGCGTKTDTKDLILPENGAGITVPTAGSDSNIYLNLTSIGLYSGSKGTTIANTNLEFGYVLNTLAVGDNLPKSEITSTSADVSFHTWCYYLSGGMINYTEKVVEDVNLYQAVFKYNGDYTPTSTPVAETSSTGEALTSSTGSGETPTISSTGQEVPATEITYYFLDQSWWSVDSAESWAYMWKDGTANSQKLNWPGEIMTQVSKDESTGNSIWSITIDIAQYDRLVISRRKGDVDWGAQTVDITLTDAFNTITLTTTVTWGTDPAADVTTSLETYE